MKPKVRHECGQSTGGKLMARSTLDPDLDLQRRPGARPPDPSNTGSLGPSDSSDSGSDVQHARRAAVDNGELDQHAETLGEDALESDTDRAGTGERASADGDANLRPNNDILPDREDEDPGAPHDEASDLAPRQPRARRRRK
ncbi:chemotaxis protein [Pandoraea pnomenusa]|uniref:chemotaxis protein n=1 Tax=Pandoraea pnomenusa TaxID=93220 RepID=UPI00242F1DBC|nr:chemotaxis protein [Pandoraea pnomenusa]